MVNSASHRLFIRKIFKNCFIVRKDLINNKILDEYESWKPQKNEIF
jgi:hypothetical protein